MNGHSLKQREETEVKETIELFTEPTFRETSPFDKFLRL